MVDVFSILIIVAGFVFVQYLHQKHIIKLELLLKAKDAWEARELYREFKTNKQEITSDAPVDLQEEVANAKSPEDIRKMFGRDESGAAA